MSLVISIVGAILAIFLIIVLHELGHFFVARLFGIKILRFSIGFGRALYTRVGRDGTEYVLALIPLGGYVKMQGEGVGTHLPDNSRSFNAKPLWVRMAVVLAGPMTNFILAVVVFWAALLVGIGHVKPVIGEVIPGSFAAAAHLHAGDRIVRIDDESVRDWQQVMVALLSLMGDATPAPLWVLPQNSVTLVKRSIDLSSWRIDKRDPLLFESLGMLPYVPPARPVLLSILPKSPAVHSGLLAGDVIKAFNNRPITDWSVVAKAIAASPHQWMKLTVQRGTQRQTVLVKLGAQVREKKTVGYLGVMVVPPQYPASMIDIDHHTVLSAWKPALTKAWLFLQYNAIVLVKMITAKLSIKTMGGPISILQAAGQSTQAGWGVYLSFIGFISLTVGFINLLPIPGLDGGHLLFQLVEAIIRRPVPDKIQQHGLTIGLLFVLLLIVHATINDLLRILG